MAELYAKYSNYKNRELQEMLVHNDQKKSGSKDELVRRILDCELISRVLSQLEV
jgi:hypothetical protein